MKFIAGFTRTSEKFEDYFFHFKREQILNMKKILVSGTSSVGDAVTDGQTCIHETPGSYLD